MHLNCATEPQPDPSLNTPNRRLKLNLGTLLGYRHQMFVFCVRTGDLLGELETKVINEPITTSRPHRLDHVVYLCGSTSATLYEIGENSIGSGTGQAFPFIFNFNFFIINL